MLCCYGGTEQIMGKLRVRQIGYYEARFKRELSLRRSAKRASFSKGKAIDVFLPEDKKLCFLLERVHTAITDKEVSILRKFKLTPKQYHVLEFVFLSSAAPVISEIVEELRMSYGNLFAITKNLEKKGLVICETVKSDHRHKALRLTEEGHIVFEKVQPLYDKIMGNIFLSLPKEQKQSITSNLNNVLGRFVMDKIE